MFSDRGDSLGDSCLNEGQELRGCRLTPRGSSGGLTSPLREICDRDDQVKIRLSLQHRLDLTHTYAYAHGRARKKNERTCLIVHRFFFLSPRRWRRHCVNRPCDVGDAAIDESKRNEMNEAGGGRGDCKARKNI